jgi:hypothetical protein
MGTTRFHDTGVVMKLDQQQNFKLTAMINDNARDLNIDTDFFYELVKSVIDSTDTSHRLNSMHRLLNVLGNKNLVASAQAAVNAYNVVTKIRENTDQKDYKWTRQKNVRGELSYTSECGVINRIYETYTTRSIGSRTTYYNFVYEGETFDTLTAAKDFAESEYAEKVSA